MAKPRALRRILTTTVVILVALSMVWYLALPFFRF